LWHVAIIITEDSIEQLRNEALVDAFDFLRLLDVRLHEFEDLFLDGSEAADLWRLGGNQSWEAFQDLLSNVSIGFLPSVATDVLMIALTALYSSSMSIKFLLICGTKKVPIETQAATLVLRMLFRTLTFSGLDKTSTLLDA
jgi:hypothetical protein